MLEGILSRLPVKGATKIGASGLFADFLPILDVNGKIPTAMLYINPTVVINASDVVYSPVSTSPALSGTNLQAVIEQIYLGYPQISKNLEEISKPAGFNNLRQVASATYAGVVELAVDEEVQNGIDIPSRPTTATHTTIVNGNPVRLVVTPSAAVAVFLQKTGGTMTGSLTLAGNPTTDTMAASKLYVDTAVVAAIVGAGLTTIPTENLIWVSKGATATNTRVAGDKYFLAKPFATLAAAKTAAVSGDTISVLPGTYNEKNLLKPGVNWFFYPGADILSTVSSGGALFDDTGLGACVCSILGHGSFTNTSLVSASKAQILFAGNTGTDIDFNGRRVGSGGVNSGEPNIRVDGLAKVTCQVRSLVSGSGGAAYVTGGNLVLEFDTLTGETGFRLLGGKSHIRCNSGITLYSRALELGGTASVELYAPELRIDVVDSAASLIESAAGSTVDATIEIHKMTFSGGAAPIKLMGGRVRFRNCRFYNTGTSSLSNLIFFLDNLPADTNMRVILENCGLSLASGFYGLIVNPVHNAPVTVLLHGYNRGTAPKGPNVTFKWGVFEQVTASEI